MATKFNIQGDLIGTTADNVEYSKQGWQNATNAKTALDDLQDRLSNVENGEGSSTHVESAADVPYTNNSWANVTNVEEALDDVQERLIALEPDASDGPVIYAYGDSISTDSVGTDKGNGYIITTGVPSPSNWPKCFARLLNAKTYVNYAASGANAGTELSQIGNYPPSASADYVTLMIGYNDSVCGNNVNTQMAFDANLANAASALALVDALPDLWSKNYETEPMATARATYLGKVAWIIRRALDAAPQAKVILCTPMWCGVDGDYWPATDDSNDTKRWQKRLLMKMRASLKDLADLINADGGNGRVIYVDTYKARIDKNNKDQFFLSTDNTHPSREGSQHIADFVYKHGVLQKPVSKFLDRPRFRVAGDFDGSTGDVKFSCPAGESVTKTLYVNGEWCGDLDAIWLSGGGRNSYTFTTEILADSAQNVVNKAFNITFSPPSSASVGDAISGSIRIRFHTPALEGVFFGVIGTVTEAGR